MNMYQGFDRQELSFTRDAACIIVHSVLSVHDGLKKGRQPIILSMTRWAFALADGLHGYRSKNDLSGGSENEAFARPPPNYVKRRRPMEERKMSARTRPVADTIATAEQRHMYCRVHRGKNSKHHGVNLQIVPMYHAQ